MNWFFWRPKMIFPEMERYEPKHFIVQEFVDSISFSERGKKAISVMDWRMLWTADAIREYFNKPVIINNWHTGGNRRWSGIRYKESHIIVVILNIHLDVLLIFILKEWTQLMLELR